MGRGRSSSTTDRPKRPQRGALIGLLTLLGSAQSLFGAAWAQAAPTPEPPRTPDTPLTTAPPAKARINTTGADLVLIVPLRERTILGEVRMRLGADDSLLVAGEDVVTVLSRTIAPEAAAALKQRFDADGSLSPDAMAREGYALAFDPAMAELTIEIPVDARQRRRIGLGFADENDEAAANEAQAVVQKPQPFSLFLNQRSAVTFEHAGPQEGFGGVRSDIELNGRIAPFAFENDISFASEAETQWVRGGSRLVYDDLDRRARWTAGDLRPVGIGFQSAPQVAGLSVERVRYRFASDRTVAQRTQRSVTLRRPANVEVRVNDQLLRTLRLNPGVYDIYDFPVSSGANAVELTIIDATGEREVVRFDLFFDSTLLPPGMDEFSAAAGIRSRATGDGLDYDRDAPIATAFYRRGFTDRLTAGAAAEIGENERQIGGEALYVSNLGLSRLNLAVSDIANVGSGYALRGEHYWSRQLSDGRGAEVLGLSVETRSADFGGIGGPSASAYSLLAAAQYGRPLTRTIALSLGGDLGIGRGSQDTQYGFGADLSIALPRATNLSFGVSYQSGDEDGQGFNAQVRLTRRFGANAISVGADTRQSRVFAGFSRLPERVLDAVRWSADVSRSDVGWTGAGSASITTNRGEAALDHFANYDTDDGEIASQSSTLSYASGLGFAGGRMGWGQQITDGFAIVRGHESLENRQVFIRTGVDAEETARSGAFGPALVGVSAFVVNSVPYDVKDLPLGYDLGDGAFTLNPPYRAGYALTIGSAYNFTALGEALDAEGQPVPLRLGTVESLTDPKAPKIEVFTNRLGRFGAAGIGPGRWRLTLGGQEPLIYEFEIIKTPDAFSELGALRPIEPNP